MIRLIAVLSGFLFFSGCAKERSGVIRMKSGEVLTVYFPNNNKIIIDLEYVSQGVGLMGDLGDFPSIERVSFVETTNGVDQIAYSDKNGDGMPELKFVTREFEGRQTHEVFEVIPSFKLLDVE